MYKSPEIMYVMQHICNFQQFITVRCYIIRNWLHVIAIQFQTDSRLIRSYLWHFKAKK